MQDIAVFYNSFQSASAALEKLSGVLEERPSVPEPERPTPLPSARGEVTFTAVRFGYRTDGPPAAASSGADRGAERDDGRSGRPPGRAERDEAERDEIVLPR